MSEYREPDSKGYLIGTYLFGEDEEMIQKSAEFWGEFDLWENGTLTARYTRGWIGPLGDGDNSEDLDRDSVIGSTGLRFHWPVGDQFNLGFKTNVVYRDYNEVEGFSYRFMPILQWNPVEFLHFRYIYEFDYIPENSFRDETFENPNGVLVSKGSEVQQETALYVRLIGNQFSEIFEEKDFLPPLSSHCHMRLRSRQALVKIKKPEKVFLA